MNIPNLESAFLLLCGVAFVLAVFLFVALGCILRQSRELARHRLIVDQEGRKRVDKSRSVVFGQVAEHFAPLLPGFAYSVKDARFLGQPVDYLIFHGLSEGKELELVFCEIKTGGAKLSTHELALKKAIEAGRVRFEVLRLEKNGRFKQE